MAHEFETLVGFQSALEKTAVRLKGIDTRVMTLQSGLQLASEICLEVGANGKKIYFIGNGGSASIASHKALDAWNHAGIEAVAFNDASLLTCMANDFGYENVFARPLKKFARREDLLIAISSGGKSKSILNAVAAAKEIGMKVIGLSGFKSDNPLAMSSDLSFHVPSNSYGIVESAHFLLLHTLLDEVARLSRESNVLVGKTKSIATKELHDLL